VLSALLALLEMAKLGEVRLAQTAAFGAVEIARGPGDLVEPPDGPTPAPAPPTPPSGEPARAAA
jgi:hypothetical protein